MIETNQLLDETILVFGEALLMNTLSHLVDSIILIIFQSVQLLECLRLPPNIIRYLLILRILQTTLSPQVFIIAVFFTETFQIWIYNFAYFDPADVFFEGATVAASLAVKFKVAVGARWWHLQILRPLFILWLLSTIQLA